MVLDRSHARALAVEISGLSSLWIMYHLNLNMMMPHDMLNMRTQP